MGGIATLRWPAGILLAAGLTVAASRVAFGHSVIGHLDPDGLRALYDQASSIGGALLGFLLAAIAILVSLDRTREIVQELHRGEAFELLIVNLLAACALLFVLLGMGVVGAGTSPDSMIFRIVFEVVGVAAAMELAIGGFYFGLVTYKVGSEKVGP